MSEPPRTNHTAEELARLGDWYDDHDAILGEDPDAYMLTTEALERIVAARVAEALAPIEALADEAVTAIASASHAHWREGGAGGVCRTCQAASERAADLHARFREVLPAPEPTP